MTDQGATPGVFQILNGSGADALTAEQKFRLNKATSSSTEALMTDAQRQFGVTMVEVEEDDTPLETVTGTSLTLESGRAYFCSIDANGTTFVLPAPSDTSKLHTVLVQFETHAGAVVAFNFPAGTVIVSSGTTVASNKHYTASCMYRQYWDSTLATPALAWKWVVNIAEDTV